MALTQEQFSGLRAKGLSTEQIIKFDGGYKPQAEAKPDYNPSDFAMGGLPGLATGRGTTAADKGASAADIPGLVAKAATGYGLGLPQALAERPFAGPMESFSPVNKNLVPNAVESITPKPVTQEGKKLGGEVEKFAGAAGAGAFASEVPKIYGAAKNYITLKMAGSPDAVMQKAEEELIKILQPQTKKLDRASQKGMSAPESITKSIPFVQPSKDYEELAGTLGKAKRSVVKNRNDILRNDNFKISEDYLLPLKDEIESMKRQPQTASIQKDLGEMQGVLDAYDKYNQEKGFNRVQAQAHKTILQRQTEPLLKKMAAGENITRSPAEIKALDKIRFGLKTMVEGDNPDVKGFNENYAALKETSQLAQHQANLAKKATPNFMEKTPIVKNIVQAIRSRAYPEQVALRALNNEPSMNSRTKEIARLFEIANKAKKQTSIPLASGAKAVNQIGQAASAKMIGGPRVLKGLGVSSAEGQGFTRMLDPKAIEAAKAASETALKEKSLADFAKKLLTPEGTTSGGKKPNLKEMGLNPFSDEIKYGKPKTALQAAMLRRGGE